MRSQITIFTNKEVTERLKNVFLENNSVELVSQKREPLLTTKVRAKLKMIRMDVSSKWHAFTYFLKYRRSPGPMVGGGGGFDYESLYGFVANFFTISFFAQNIAWDMLKMVIVKSYRHLESSGREYVVIASSPTMPMDTLLRMEIPNDLSDEELDRCLDSAEKIWKNIYEIRHHFGYFKIFIRYNNHRWKLRFKGKFS